MMNKVKSMGNGTHLATCMVAEPIRETGDLRRGVKLVNKVEVETSQIIKKIAQRNETEQSQHQAEEQNQQQTEEQSQQQAEEQRQQQAKQTKGRRPRQGEVRGETPQRKAAASQPPSI